MESYGPFHSLNDVVRFWTAVFGLWAVSATVCFGLASWKQKNPILWVLLGLVFGPFALLVLVFKSCKKTPSPPEGDHR